MSGGAAWLPWQTAASFFGPLVGLHQKNALESIENTETDKAASKAQQMAAQAAAAEKEQAQGRAATEAKAAADAKAAAEAADMEAKEALLAKRRRGASSILTSARGVLGSPSVTAKALLGGSKTILGG